MWRGAPIRVLVLHAGHQKGASLICTRLLCVNTPRTRAVIKTEIAMIGIPTGGAAKTVGTLRFVRTFRGPEDF